MRGIDQVLDWPRGAEVVVDVLDASFVECGVGFADGEEVYWERLGRRAFRDCERSREG